MSKTVSTNGHSGRKLPSRRVFVYSCRSEYIKLKGSLTYGLRSQSMCVDVQVCKTQCNHNAAFRHMH
eukprot:5908536-Amphidinium_carterae.1